MAVMFSVQNDRDENCHVLVQPRDATIFLCRDSVHHDAFLEASVYTWHGPNIILCVRFIAAPFRP